MVGPRSSSPRTHIASTPGMPGDNRSKVGRLRRRIGPVLATILLYTSLEATMAQGTLLLLTYALGLGLPFVLASVAFNWFVAGAEHVKRWMVPLERIAGTLLVVIGLLMASGSFARMTAFLAGLGQLITLEMQ